jgi:hypothetical protein
MYTLKDYESIPVKTFSKPSLGYHKVKCVDSWFDCDYVELQPSTFSTRHKPFYSVEMQKDYPSTAWRPRIGNIVEVKYVDNNVTISKTTLLSRILNYFKRSA